MVRESSTEVTTTPFLVDETDLNVRNRLISETFCYLGNPNNPPDSMLKNGGDAIEVKKIEAPNAALALNSSYPKENYIQTVK